ncbi:MAG: FISUMP domain-containing protein [Kordia sp.]|uniref:FISUMP domain-containing protein n=1 Tax=Kordia sp. TaxID=1965332 RepID=UPI00385E1027
MKKYHFILVLISFGLMLSSCDEDEDNVENQNQEITLTDIDGNIYQTVTIGNQVWMAENLKTTTLNDGTPITEYRHFDPNQSSFSWIDTSNPQMLFQWADTSDLGNLYPDELPFEFYGAHYNNETIVSGKLEIEGWRLPTQQDFIELRDYVASQGNSGNEATVLKSEIGWFDSSINGTDQYGFNVKPAGNTILGGTPDFASLNARLCTSDINPTNNKRKLATFFDNDEISFEEMDVRNGFSVRLIKE